MRSSSVRSVVCSSGKYAGPSGSSETRSSAELADALLRLRAHRMERMEVAERRGGLHLGRDVGGLEPVDLVQRDDDRLLRARTRGAPRSGRPSRCAARASTTRSTASTSVERRVDGLLHALGQRVHRALEAGQVDERELVVGAVRDAEDPPPRRVRHGRRDRDLLAAESVDERRLADVRTACDRDEPGFHVRSELSNDSGRSSSGVIVTMRPPLRNTTRSTPISCSHCRQPPHGDAVIAATAKSPGL